MKGKILARSLGLLGATLVAIHTSNTNAQIQFGDNEIVGSENSVAAGHSNTNYAEFSLIGGGTDNAIEGYSDRSAIGNGEKNRIVDSTVSFIGAGEDNLILESFYSFIGAGHENFIYGTYFSMIGCGYENFIGGFSGVIGGGFQNSLTLNTSASIIAGGYQNTNNTVGSTISGGGWNRIEGDYSTIPGGLMARTISHGQMAHASGSFGLIAGSAQASEYVLRRTITTTNATELFLTGETFGDKRVLLPSDGTWIFEVMVVARAADGKSAGFKTNGVIKTVSGSTSLNGTVGGTMAVGALFSDVGAWAVSVQADDSNDALVIKVNGDASTNRWVATVRTTEVRF